MTSESDESVLSTKGVKKDEKGRVRFRTLGADKSGKSDNDE